VKDFHARTFQTLRSDVVRPARERRDANHFVLDSLVFDRNDLGAMPPRVHLWKKFLAWVKPTQRPRFAMLLRFAKRNLRRRRETGIEFPICAKTSIS
jgi:hypothetical protein